VKEVIKISEQLIKSAGGAADEFQSVVSETERSIDSKIAPVRKSLLKRFPTLFLLLVTFGATAVFFSIETIMKQSAWWSGHPWVTLAIGIGILVLTGRLYRKLG